ncbi:hypothetical protein 268TH004_5 [Bacillus phage 268TH004]|uniref:Uncharacterized protein n=1 Tax=Bacillus phage 268TH004 TaxID=2801523 RepID=A0A7T8C651_9CAUD|nr:hypothetical protein 276BB001_5 [Bacillus phage 276BB001]QFG05926.1 hypothetical protein 280BB001_5 [Bacillus phage 280BB001]QQO40351.1 hypothetical protein 268TH004_5 [Bacillus phage 268TH004]QZA70075.1 hypothetical protein 274BB002_5 [Bacillus phage 274BB002]
MSIELNVYRAINSLYDDVTPEVLEDSQSFDAVYVLASFFAYVLTGEPTFEYEVLHEVAESKLNELKEMVGYIDPEEEN